MTGRLENDTQYTNKNEKNNTSLFLPSALLQSVQQGIVDMMNDYTAILRVCIGNKDGSIVSQQKCGWKTNRYQGKTCPE